MALILVVFTLEDVTVGEHGGSLPVPVAMLPVAGVHSAIGVAHGALALRQLRARQDLSIKLSLIAVRVDDPFFFAISTAVDDEEDAEDIPTGANDDDVDDDEALTASLFGNAWERGIASDGGSMAPVPGPARLGLDWALLDRGMLEAAISEGVRALSMTESLVEFPFVLGSVRPCVFAFTLALVHVELTGVDSPVLPFVHAVAMALILVVFTLEDVTVGEHGGSLPVPVAMLPVAGVHSAIGVAHGALALRQLRARQDLSIKLSLIAVRVDDPFFFAISTAVDDEEDAEDIPTGANDDDVDDDEALTASLFGNAWERGIASDGGSMAPVPGPARLGLDWALLDRGM
eukprot:CAMPEP_0198134108 /NCGR_PEP_ID=MMETSP1442-20131203/59902_1 /TAXON_ID= /ORGANISM="Craspedostauros australis, Strain CCMP3328" /LENGTH=345 /DNA_ID=CAMNT_0043795247 /DNA_START=2542 /DNA_END=3578 /DNA_ORIENTATION=+